MIFSDKTHDTSDLEPSSDAMSEAEDEALTDALPSPRTTARDGRFGKVVGGRYRIQDRLGKGGMASVYRAVDRLNGNEYAVKILDPRYARDPSMARRCQREARAMADLANRHIPCAFVVGTTDEGETYIVMEFLRGRDLEQLILTDPPMSWRRAFRLTIQLCEALQAAHAQNIIHRDVKPSNCFLIQEGDDGADLVKLIDFGIAKDLTAKGDPTGTGMVLGTPGYLAPELMEGACAPSALTDVYALGVTLYKLLTHRLPWEGRSYVDVVVSQRRDAPHPIRIGMATAGRRMPHAAEVVVMTAFASIPQERYGSARAFAAALRAVLRDHPESVHEADEVEVAIEADFMPLDASAPEPVPAPPSTDQPPTTAPPPTRSLSEPGQDSPRTPLWTLAATVLTFVGILLAFPTAPARPLGPSPIRAVAHPIPAASRIKPVDDSTSTATKLANPQVTQPTNDLTGQSATDPADQPATDLAPAPADIRTVSKPRDIPGTERAPVPRGRPFKPGVIRKEIEGEHAYLIKTCAAKAPKRRVLDFTLFIDPSGRLTSVKAAPKDFRRCVRDLWLQTRFDASDTGGSVTYRLNVPEAPPPPLLMKLLK